MLLVARNCVEAADSTVVVTNLVAGYKFGLRCSLVWLSDDSRVMLYTQFGIGMELFLLLISCM